MTQETVKALADSELVQVIAWAQDEQHVRTERRKRETIAKIKELAGEAGISVSIAGTRGRPKGAIKVAAAPISEPAAPLKRPISQNR